MIQALLHNNLLNCIDHYEIYEIKDCVTNETKYTLVRIRMMVIHSREYDITK